MRCTLYVEYSYPTPDYETLDYTIWPEPQDQLDPELLADHWTGGNGLSARQVPSKAKPAKPKFESAGFLAVAIDLTQLPLQAVLTSPYTNRYCTVAAYPEASGQDGTVCLLAFALPAAESDRSKYLTLQAGLEARYRGAMRASGVLHVYRADGLTRATVIGQALDAAAVKDLLRLGGDAPQIASQPEDVVRSRLRLTLDDLVRTADGKECRFADLHPDTQVYCPVHADISAEALATRLDDHRPILHCAHCHRSYTVRDASNDYDFDHFPRTVRALAEAEAAEAAVLAPTGEEATGQRQFVLTDAPYLGSIALKPGIVCIKSPKGSGKTEALVDFVRRCRRANKHVLLIGNRRSLLSSMAARLNLWCYIVPWDHREPAPKDKQTRNALLYVGLKEKPAKAVKAAHYDKVVHSLLEFPAPGSDDVLAGKGPRFGTPRYFYAISLDSLTKLDPKRHRYPVVIIDEAEQVFAHLIGSTLRERRREVYLLLAHYLRVAETVVLLDADLGMVTMDALFSMGLKDDTDVSFVLNESKQAKGTTHMYATRGQLVGRLRQAVADGGKCYVATNSKNKAIELQKALAEEFPERRIFAIHSDNSSDLWTHEFLRDAAYEFEHSIDVLIASPSIGTGVDITFKDKDGKPRVVVGHVFGLFHGNITTHQDMDQQLARVRHPGQVHVWVEPTEQHFETDIGVIRNELARTVGHTRSICGYTDDGNAILHRSDGLTDIWARVKSSTRGSNNRLAALFVALRMASGWQVETVPGDKGQGHAGDAALKQGRTARLEDRAQQILAASPLTGLEAEHLTDRDKAGLPLTAAQRAALERHRMERFYAESVSPELIELDKDGRTRQCIRNLEILLSNKREARAQDRKQLVDEVWDGDLVARQFKAGLLRKVLGAAGLFDGARCDINDNAVVEQGTLEPFIAALRVSAKQFESAYELKPRADADDRRVQQLNAVLALIGLKVVEIGVSDAGGKKVRRYGFETEVLDRLRDVVAQRRQAAAERREAKAKAEAAKEQRLAGKIDLPAFMQRMKKFRDNYRPG